MKKSHILSIFVFLIITNIIFISTTIFYKIQNNKQRIKIYSFEGECGDMKITNGLIVISPNKQTLYGGKIEYTGNSKKNICSYSKTIYLDKQGSKNTILTTSVSCCEGMSFTDELTLNKDLGQISSEKLFSEDDINIIKNNLYFSLDYSTGNKQTERFKIKLNVKEV